MSAIQNGLLRVLSNEQLMAADAAAQAAEARQNEPVILNLATYVRKCFDAADRAKRLHEVDMLNALRMRNGEYAPDQLAEIRKTGGSEIYMRVGATKMRAAQSWLKDIFLTMSRPFTVVPTPEPDVPSDQLSNVDALVQQVIAQGVMQGAPPPMAEEIDALREGTVKQIRLELDKVAKERAERAEQRIDDILTEGGFYRALDECLSDITTFKGCILKGPIVRKRVQLKWKRGVDPTTQQPGAWQAVPVSDYKFEFERVNPLAFYPSPNTCRPDRGYVIERHKMSREDLYSLIGVDGFDSAAIQKVLEEYGLGGLRNWLSVDSEEQQALGNLTDLSSDPAAPIEALEFYGSVQGKLLLEWGMAPDKVPDPVAEYRANVWVIGAYVIRATLNTDPLGRTPYSVSSWEKLPGSFWGIGPAELMTDVSAVCNATARALVNNMGIASGPQVTVNTDRLAEGENITSMFPWKLWQTKNDPMANDSSQPIAFFQPQSNAQELLGVYEKFTTIADEVTSIPRYMMGDSQVGGAGRTAAGLSMLMNAANKGIKNVANNIDTDLLVPTVERVYYFLMLYDEDQTIKGDAQIRARGASGLMLKELLNQRRLEFLQIISNPIDAQLIGPDRRAVILREIGKGLEFPIDDIVPSDAEIDQVRRMMAMQAAAPAGATPEKPDDPTTVDQELRANSTGPKPTANQQE